MRTSNMLRQAAVINGGLIYAARGPLTAGIHHGRTARRAPSRSSSISAAPCSPPKAPIACARRSIFSAASFLSRARSSPNDVTYGGGFDLGRMVVRGDAGEATLGVYNEFMTADIDGKRVATFPDMIGTLDPQTGDVVSISESKAGARVAVIIAAPVEISGRQGRARSRGVSGSRAGDGRRPALVSLKKG